MQLYHQTSFDLSRIITRNYSTSFYFASLFYTRKIRQAIFGIYGFVRFADEVVDTFHAYDKEALLDNFEKDLEVSLERGISLNPVLHSFQRVVKEYGISQKHIAAFLRSMRNDLVKQDYTSVSEMEDYIFGSAEVVGLMCLKVFCGGNQNLYDELEGAAMNLGKAFQKVNFIRDLQADMGELGRSYFPQIKEGYFDEAIKKEIVLDIERDFNAAFLGLKKLPWDAKMAVLIAFYYYRCLLKKIKRTPAQHMMTNRIRISNLSKFMLMAKAVCVTKFKMV